MASKKAKKTKKTAKPAAKKVKAAAKSKTKATTKSKFKMVAKAQPKAAVKAKDKFKTKLETKSKSKVQAKNLKSKVKTVKTSKAKAQKTQKVQKAKISSKAASRAGVFSQPVKGGKASSAVVATQKPAQNVDYSKAITPLGDRLVVRIVQNEKVTAGGLIIPDTVSEAAGFLKATVLAVGRGSQNKKGFIKTMDVQIGDDVLFSQYAGTKVKFNSEDLQIIHETDVMGIVQK